MVFGNTLHVIGREGVEMEGEIRTLFEREGIRLTGMEWIRASLEDVFVSLIQGEREP